MKSINIFLKSMARMNIQRLADYRETVCDKGEILAKPQFWHGLFTLLAGTILPALLSALKPRINRTRIKTLRSFLDTHGSDKDTYSDTEEEATED